MKKAFSVFLAALFFILCACGKSSPPAPVPSETVENSIPEEKEELVSPLSFYMDIQFLEKSNDSGLLCRVEYPVLKLEAADGEKFPSLKNAIDNINNAFISNGSSMYSQLLTAAEQSFNADRESFSPLYRCTSLVLPRADSTAVSILYKSEVRSGSEITDVAFSSLTCDSVTGRELTIRKIVKDLPALRSLLEQLLPQKYPKVEFKDLMSSLNRYMEDPAQFIWTLDYQGITLYFNPYDIAPGEAGLLTLSLRFDNYPELFETAYTKVPPTYTVPLVSGACFNFDIDLNGASDDISVTDSYNEKLGYSDVLKITVNGNTVTTKTGLKSYDCYVIHAGLGRDYLFINGENLSDYGYINVFRLARTGASFVGGLYDTSLQSAGYSGHCAGKPLLTNPDSFYLGSKCDLLFTQSGIKNYRIGSDGMPVSNSETFLLDSSVVLTSRQELSTVSIDPNTGSGNQAAVKIPAGSQYYFWRTDGKSFVDMMTSDGICCRLFISGSSPQRVNGISVSELFEIEK